MEQSLIQVLENHRDDAKDYPPLSQRFDQHITETRRHAEMVRDCLASLDAKPSTMKAAVGNVMGLVQGAATGMFRDELVKNCLADYGMEHFEIACYRSLIAAAEELGEPEIAELCREILTEEEAMAHWLEEQIPEVTRHTLQQETHA